MGYTISSPTSESCKSMYWNVLIKRQIFVLNLSMLKTKWEGAEDPIIKKIFKIESRKYINM